MSFFVLFVAWINSEEALFKASESQYPGVDEIGTMIDPFQKLFLSVSKWQKAEKKYVRLEHIDYNLLSYVTYIATF